MASIGKLSLNNGSISGASTLTEPKSLGENSTQFVAYLKVTALGAGTTLTAKIQHSPNGDDWYDVASFAAVPAASAPTSEVIDWGDFTQPQMGLFPKIRGSLALAGGTTTGTVQLDLWFDPNR